jgi:Asp/Glu/hydantoin racemase
MAQDHARLGILMLSSRFPRIPGDVGNPATWDFPVRYAVVPGATPQAIVYGDPEPHVQAFIAAGRDLVASGCTGIATTCGFLAPLRARLAEALQVPVAASALEQAASLQAMLPPGRRVGILTISKASLTPAHLTAAGVPETAEIAGVDDSSFARSILSDAPTLDVDAARAEIREACAALVQRHSDIGAILLECTNMVPYAPDVALATGLPVYSIYSYLTWFHAGLAPATFPAPSRSQPSLNA